MYLKANDLCIDYIARDLYDFKMPGVIGVPCIVTQEARSDILAGISSVRHLFVTPKRTVDKVTQEMGQLYAETLSPKQYPRFMGPIQALAEEYAAIHAEIGKRAGFSRPFTSVGVFFYPRGSIGITPHRDFASDADLVTSIVLSGNAPFCVHPTRDVPGEPVPSDTGSIIFLRAARNPNEQIHRPFHSIEGPVKQDRYSVLFRTDTFKRPYLRR